MLSELFFVRLTWTPLTKIPGSAHALLICLFTQRTHMLTSYSIKWIGLREIFLKPPLKAMPPAIPHRVGGDHEFSGTKDRDTGRRRAVDNVSDYVRV